MADAIDDEVVHAFAVVGPQESFAHEVQRRFGGLVDRIQIGMTGIDPDGTASVVETLRRASAGA